MSDKALAPNPIPGWKPQDDICIAFSDETAGRRSAAKLEALLADIREAAGRHGFDIAQTGTRAGFARFFHQAFNADGSYRIPVTPETHHTQTTPPIPDAAVIAARLAYHAVRLQEASTTRNVSEWDMQAFRAAIEAAWEKMR